MKKLIILLAISISGHALTFSPTATLITRDQFNQPMGIVSDAQVQPLHIKITNSADTSQRETYMTFFPAALQSSQPLPTLLITMPYEVLSWSTDSLKDQPFATAVISAAGISQISTTLSSGAPWYSILFNLPERYADSNIVLPFAPDTVSSNLTGNLDSDIFLFNNASAYMSNGNNINVAYLFTRYYRADGLSADASDVALALNYLSSNPDLLAGLVDKNHIGVQGTSWGGAVAALGVALSGVHVKSLSLLYPLVGITDALGQYDVFLPGLLGTISGQAQAYNSFWLPRFRRLTNTSPLAASNLLSTDGLAHELVNLVTATMVIEDDYDSLIPIASAQNLVSSMQSLRPGSASGIFITHQSLGLPLNYSTAPLGHSTWGLDSNGNPTCSVVCNYGLLLPEDAGSGGTFTVADNTFLVSEVLYQLKDGSGQTQIGDPHNFPVVLYHFTNEWQFRSVDISGFVQSLTQMVSLNVGVSCNGNIYWYPGHQVISEMFTALSSGAEYCEIRGSLTGKTTPLTTTLELQYYAFFEPYD